MEKTRKDGFKLIGLKLNKKTTNDGGQSSIDCGNLWQKIERENFVGRIPNKLSKDVYAVYFEYEGDHTKPFSYFIGCSVNADTDVPKDMDSLFIPEQNYFKVVARGIMPDCIAKSWKDIWNSKIERAYHYDFEVYDERSKDWSNAEVEIFVSSN
jgi:predicted transcriptional regulator YdeE